MTIQDFLELINLEMTNADMLPYAVERTDYSAKNFGNALAVIRFDSLRITFVKERGQVFIDVSSVALPKKEVPCDTVFEKLNSERGLSLLSDTCPENWKLALSQIRENITLIERLLNDWQSCEKSLE